MINDKWKMENECEEAGLISRLPFIIFNLSFVALVALSILVLPAKAEHLPTDARASVIGSRVPFPGGTDFSLWAAQKNQRLRSVPPAATVERVGPVGMTVSDMDRSIDFYSKILSFEKISDVELTGDDYERLQGVFGLRIRVVRMRLGDELIELTEYLAPKGRVDKFLGELIWMSKVLRYGRESVSI